MGGWWKSVWCACGKWALFCFFLFLSFFLSFPQPYVRYLLTRFTRVPPVSSPAVIGSRPLHFHTALSLLMIIGMCKETSSLSIPSYTMQRLHSLSFPVNERKRKREKANCTVLYLLYCTTNTQVLYIRYLMQQLPVCKPCAKARTQPEVHIDERRRLGKMV